MKNFEEKSSKKLNEEEIHNLKRERILNSQEYRDFIEQIKNQNDIIDKLILAFANYWENERASGKLHDVFEKHSPEYNKELTESIIDELKSTIQTPKQLDIFLSELITRLHHYYESRSLSRDNFNDYDGHPFARYIILHIINPAFNMSHHSDNELDWWYTLAKYLSFSSTIMMGGVRIAYIKHMNDPRSIEFKKYLISHGILEQYFKDTEEYAKRYLNS